MTRVNLDKVNTEPNLYRTVMPSLELASKRQAAREVIDILSEISLLLVCALQ